MKYLLWIATDLDFGFFLITIVFVCAGIEDKKIKKGIFIFSWRENAALVLGESFGNSSPRRESFSCSVR